MLHSVKLPEGQQQPDISLIEELRSVYTAKLDSIVNEEDSFDIVEAMRWPGVSLNELRQGDALSHFVEAYSKDEGTLMNLYESLSRVFKMSNRWDWHKQEWRPM
jgi:hypothetical protein